MNIEDKTMNTETMTASNPVDLQALSSVYNNYSLMEAMGRLLNSVGETLGFDVSRTGEDSFRVVLTLKVPGIEAGSRASTEPFKSLIKGYEQARSLLVKPLMFSGTMPEIEAEMRAFVEQGRADDLCEARAELSSVADKVRKLIEEAEQKSNKPTQKGASKAKSSCGSGGKACSTKNDADKSKDKKEEAKPEPEQPPAPKIPDLFA